MRKGAAMVRRPDHSCGDKASLTRALKLLLTVGAVLALVSAVSSLLQVELLNREDFTEDEAEANDAREQLIGGLSLLLYLSTVIVFSFWIVRANTNVRIFGARGLRFSPGMALGSFFIPVLNFWRPCQAMSDLWRASHSPSSWEETDTGQVLPLWWGCWLITALTGQIGFRLMMRAEELDEILAATWWQCSSEIADLALCLLAYKLVAQIAHAQSRHQIASLPPPLPPIATGGDHEPA